MPTIPEKVIAVLKSAEISGNKVAIRQVDDCDPHLFEVDGEEV